MSVAKAGHKGKEEGKRRKDEGGQRAHLAPDISRVDVTLEAVERNE
jgi:hypothetical protein